MKFYNASLVFMLILVSACGGGGSSDDTTQNLTPPSLNNAEITATVNSDFTVNLANSGGDIVSCESNIDLPNELILSAHSERCSISGQVLEPIEQTFEITGTNAAGSSTANFKLNITSEAEMAPIFEAQPELNFSTGEAVNILLINNGGAVETCEISSGQLPSELTLSQSSNSCLISGNPSNVETQTVTILGSNEHGSDSVSLSISITNVESPPQFNNPSRIEFVLNTNANLLIENQGGSVTTCEVNQGDLPSGIELSVSEGSCLIAGTPDKVETQSVEILGANNAGEDTFVITINVSESISAPDLIPVSLTQANLEESINIQVNNQGGAIDQCQITHGALPNDLTLSSTTSACVISGTASEAGDFEWVVRAENTAGTDEETVQLTINNTTDKPELQNSLTLTWNDSQENSVKFNNTGGSATACSSTPALPQGLTLVLVEQTCGIVGAAKSHALSEFTIKAENSAGADELLLSLTIEELLNDWGDGPDPDEYDFVAKMVENEFSESEDTFLVNDSDDSLFLLSTNETQVQINSLMPINGERLTEQNQIEPFFSLLVNPESGEISIIKKQPFDYERDDRFYELSIQLGDEQKSVLIRLYDVQNGSSEEPLKMHDYAEFVSFTQGELISNGETFEYINAEQPHNDNSHRVELANDIDASDSESTPFERFTFSGELHGNNHVIINLNMPNGFATSSTTNDSDFVFKHIGLIDFQSTATESIIKNVMTRGERKLSHVALTGTVHNDIGTSDEVLRYALINDNQGGMQHDSVYTNVYHRATGGNFRGSNFPEISAYLGPAPSDTGQTLKHVYVNGSLHTDATGPVKLSAGCLAASDSHSRFALNDDELFYCSLDYRVTDHGNDERQRDAIRVSMIEPIAYSNNDNPVNETSSSSNLRFVVNRNNNPVTRSVGNGVRDVDNDGQPDDYPEHPWSHRINCFEGSEIGECPKMDAHGRTEAEFKQVDNWSGEWVSSGRWDIQDGEWPVLTNMPYPHQSNSVWLFYNDPGVIYQRMTYRDYLQASKPPLTDAYIVSAPELTTPQITSFTQGEAAELLIENTGGEIFSCRTEPPLPEGLTLQVDSQGCRITGTAATELDSTSFTLYVTNSGGSSSVLLTLDILPSLPNLNTVEPQSLNVGESFDLLFANSGGAVTHCAVTPSLPAGLMIAVDNESCAISGAPSVERSSMEYSVIAENRKGSQNLEFAIEVLPPLMPPQLSGPDNVITTQGNFINIRFENQNDDDIQACQVNPSLFDGLEIQVNDEKNACILSGKTYQTGSENFVISASNSGGDDQLEFNLQVSELVWNGDGPNPINFDFVGVIRENEYNQGEETYIRQNNESYDQWLVFNSEGFPNKVLDITLDNGDVLTGSQAQEYFKLFYDANENQIYISQEQSLDYENNSHFYQLTLQLGDEQKSVLIRLYDVQDGSSEEPLKMHDYAEFVSFTQGELISNGETFEYINAEQPHNDNSHRVELANDIDASDSESTPFERFTFSGELHGNNHVIINLNMPNGFATSSTTNDSDFVFKHIGLIDFQSTATESIIKNVMTRGERKLSHVALTGTVHNDIGTSDEVLRYALINDNQGGMQHDSVYTNVYHRATGGNFRGSNFPEISAYLGPAPSDTGQTLKHVYVNGSLHTDATGPVKLSAGCLAASDSHSRFALNDDELFYCSLDYRVTDHGNDERQRDAIRVSMIEPIAYSNNDNPVNETSSSSNLRFVVNRNNNPVTRSVGNGVRDVDNDGQPDDYPEHPWSHRINCFEGSEIGECPKMDAHGRTEAEFKQVDNWSGEWVSSGRWDIQDGEWPVLTNMPYPHTEGAEWLDNIDPGILYQRLTYDKYLQDPE